MRGGLLLIPTPLRRVQQETGAASAQAQGTAQPYVEQAKQTLNNAGNVAATYVNAAQEKVSSTTSGTTTTTGQTGPSYVDQAKQLAAATADTAGTYATQATSVAQGYVNTAQVSQPKLS